jgi:hypothetical protein
MATHVKVLAGLCLAFGAFWALFTFAAPVILTMLAGLVASSGDPDAAVGSTVLGLTGVALTIFFGVQAVLYIVTGIGLWSFKRWGRILGIIVAILSVLNFPFGTAFAVYALIILFRKDTEALFV